MFQSDWAAEPHRMKKMTQFGHERDRIEYFIELANSGKFAYGEKWSEVKEVFDLTTLEDVKDNGDREIMAFLTPQPGKKKKSPDEELLYETDFVGWYVVFTLSKNYRIRHFCLTNSHK
jgi:hypothetical protein